MVGKSFRVDGADALTGLAKVLRKVRDGKEIRKALLAGLREAGRPTTERMRDELASRLPARGGAARALTSRQRTFSVRNRLSGKNAGISIEAAKGHNYRSLEVDGVLRHPKWPGDRPRKSWRWDALKTPTQGAMEAVVKANEDEFLSGIADAIDDARQAMESAVRREVG